MSEAKKYKAPAKSGKKTPLGMTITRWSRALQEVVALDTPRAPRWWELHPLWVEGGSLARLCRPKWEFPGTTTWVTRGPGSTRVTPSIGMRMMCFAKMPTRIMMEGCDRCPGPHRPNNPICSLTRHTPPRMQPGVFYSYVTGKATSHQWRLESVSVTGR
jgi:hypothetical protein